MPWWWHGEGVQVIILGGWVIKRSNFLFFYQKSILILFLESTHREELKTALRIVMLHLQGGLLHRGRQNRDFGPCT